MIEQTGKSFLALTFSCDLLALQPSDSNAEKSASDPKDILKFDFLCLNTFYSNDFEVYFIRCVVRDW